MKDQSSDSQSSMNCQLCPRNLHCSNLYMALELLKNLASEQNDSKLIFQYEDFKRRLEHLKYHYPDSQQNCLIANNNALAQELVQESIALISSLKDQAVS